MKVLQHPCFLNVTLKVIFVDGATMTKKRYGPLLGKPGDVIESIEIIFHEDNYMFEKPRINETHVVDIFADANVVIHADQIQIYRYYRSHMYDGNSIYDFMV